MSYSQKPLLELFKKGKIPGEKNVPKHIETVLSNVFIFDTTVYKIYKNDNEFINTQFRDISNKSLRFSFTEQDFKWNQTLSPSIYRSLLTVSAINNGITFSSKIDAEECVIVMNRIDTSQVLFERLVRGDITENDCFLIGENFAQNLKKIQKDISYENNFFSVFESRLKELRGFMTSVSDCISEKESLVYYDFLDTFMRSHRGLFETSLTRDVTTDGDFHSHNAIFTGTSLYFIDTFPPKESWGVGHRLIPVYRLGTDIWAITGKKQLFESFIHGYETGSGVKIDRAFDFVFILYAASIMVPYLYMLQKNDLEKTEPAKKYHSFLRTYFETVT